MRHERERATPKVSTSMRTEVEHLAVAVKASCVLQRSGAIAKFAPGTGITVRSESRPSLHGRAILAATAADPTPSDIGHHWCPCYRQQRSAFRAVDERRRPFLCCSRSDRISQPLDGIIACSLRDRRSTLPNIWPQRWAGQGIKLIGREIRGSVGPLGQAPERALGRRKRHRLLPLRRTRQP